MLRYRFEAGETLTPRVLSDKFIARDSGHLRVTRFSNAISKLVAPAVIREMTKVCCDVVCELVYYTTQCVIIA